MTRFEDPQLDPEGINDKETERDRYRETPDGKLVVIDYGDDEAGKSLEDEDDEELEEDADLEDDDDEEGED